MPSLLPNRQSLHIRLGSQDDLSKPASMNSSDTDVDNPTPAKWKGKGKAVEPAEPPLTLDSPNGHNLAASREDLIADGDGEDATYPPTTEEEEESRRIEENLRRLEMAERQKRKNSRDSKLIRPPQQRASVVGDIRLSMWSRRNSNSSYSSQRRLRQGDEEVGMDELDTRSSSPPSPMTTTHLTHAQSPMAASPVSPFASTEDTSAIMQPTPQPLRSSSLLVEGGEYKSTPLRPILEAKALSFSRRRAPTPVKPDIPPPKSPPPATPPPNATRRPARPQQQQEQHTEPRWWTEWLCGCAEDRHEDQGGATNPFE